MLNIYFGYQGRWGERVGLKGWSKLFEFLDISILRFSKLCFYVRLSDLIIMVSGQFGGDNG